MKTSKDYQTQLRQGNLSEELIGEVLFSYSKRAKNMRDKIIEYRYYDYWTKYSCDNICRCEQRRDLYYQRKNDIINICSFMPKCCHRAIYKNGKTALFFFYDIGNHTFHRPTNNANGLPVIDLEDGLWVEGETTTELLSVQFCEKVYQYLVSEKENKKCA